MPSHIALIVAITSVKNSRSCSYGYAKYKISDETSQTIRWKYFFPTSEQPQLFASGDLVFISGKYVAENSEQCITITYASIIDNKNPNREFDMRDVPICIPHCMFSVIVNRNPKDVEEFIHFGVESTEYNAVTGTSNVKMQMTVLYSSQSSRFKNYLGPSGSNIKLGNTYFVSGLIKFSTTGKMVIEATDIDYFKTLTLNYNASESSSSTIPRSRSIIDIVTDDIESITIQTPLNHIKSMASSVKSDNINASKSSETFSSIIDANVEINSSRRRKKLPQPVYLDSDAQDEERSDCEDLNKLVNAENTLCKDEEEDENLQPKKRKR
ncbi:2406_t:CDS:1, partial [Racocetra persica]